MECGAILGLGYVGLELATALSNSFHIIGYDTDVKRLNDLKKRHDKNNQLTSNTLADSNIHYTHEPEDLRKATFYIITVPTPIYDNEQPNLEPLIAVTKTLTNIIKPGDIVIYESTVYPGTTEDVCIPILEQSGLKNAQDFCVGYSPERINPGDTLHTLANTTKIISASDQNKLNAIKEIYLNACEKVHPVSNIKTAEAIKILENTQRDVNIAFMNEFTQIMHMLDVNMHEVIEGAKTKWNFVPFEPGFVGGHCIPVDPYYLIFKAKQNGIEPNLISTARKVNNNMPRFIIQELFKLLLNNNMDPCNQKLGIFGISFKKNSKDIRNSLSLKLIEELKAYNFNYAIYDPIAEQINEEIFEQNLDKLCDINIAIILVGHDIYQDIGLNGIKLHCPKLKLLMDLPNLFTHENHSDVIYWNL